MDNNPMKDGIRTKKRIISSEELTEKFFKKLKIDDSELVRNKNNSDCMALIICNQPPPLPSTRLPTISKSTVNDFYIPTLEKLENIIYKPIIIPIPKSTDSLLEDEDFGDANHNSNHNNQITEKFFLDDDICIEEAEKLVHMEVD